VQNRQKTTKNQKKKKNAIKNGVKKANASQMGGVNKKVMKKSEL